MIIRPWTDSCFRRAKDGCALFPFPSPIELLLRIFSLVRGFAAALLGIIVGLLSDCASLFVELSQVVPLQRVPVARNDTHPADRLCILISTRTIEQLWQLETYLVDVDQYDLVRSSQVHLVLGFDQICDAFDDVVPLESAVVTDGCPDCVL